MPLIDSEVLIKYIREQGLYGCGWSESEREDNVIDMIEAQPEVDSVQHGYIIKRKKGFGSVKTVTGFDKMGVKHTVQYNDMTDGDEFFCSKCGAIIAYNFTDYCPRCGTKLDLEEQNEVK